MNNFRIEHVISEIARHFIVDNRHPSTSRVTHNGHRPEYSDLRNGVYAMQFAISFHIDNYGYEREGNTHHPEWEHQFHRIIHVLVTRRCNVFVATTDHLNAEVREWCNTSNHDSCWSTDGLQIFNEIFYEGYNHCFGFIPKEHRKIPIEVEPFVQFRDWHFGKPPFKIVKVTGEYTKDHRWNVTEIKPVEFKLNVVDEVTA